MGTSSAGDPPYESLEKHRAIGTTTRLKHSKASSNDWFTIFPNARFSLLASDDLFQGLTRVRAYGVPEAQRRERHRRRAPGVMTKNSCSRHRTEGQQAAAERSPAKVPARYPSHVSPPSRGEKSTGLYLWAPLAPCLALLANLACSKCPPVPCPGPGSAFDQDTCSCRAASSPSAEAAAEVLDAGIDTDAELDSPEEPDGPDACGDIVNTPGGPAPRECVHEVPNGGAVVFDDAGGAVVVLGDEVIATYPSCPCR